LHEEGETLNKNTSHLAGEFLVAGELSRRGYPVSITFGNAKSVDIYADVHNGTIRVDAKAGRGKTNFPLEEKSVKEQVFYIFVYLQTPNKMEENVPPEYFIVPGKDIISKKLIYGWRTRHGIKYSTLKKEYKDRWDLLPHPEESIGVANNP
jgi:hypothetical protein